MAKMSYEEFERKFKDDEPKLNKVEQARKDRILKVLNQRVSETSKYGITFVKKELSLMDLRIEEIQIIENLSQKGFIKGKPTNVVYQNYKKACLQGGLKPMNQISFSKFVIKYFDYSIKDKKIKGKKYRIFTDQINPMEELKRKGSSDDWWKS